MIAETWALTQRELKKWVRNPILFIMTMMQPILWLALFGRALNLNQIASIPSDVLAALPVQLATALQSALEKGVKTLFGTTDYFTFMAAGMIVVIVMFTAMFSGMSVVWDRRLGFLNRLLAAPIPRGAITISKVLASVIRGLAQSMLLLVFALALGMQFGDGFNALSFLGIVAVLVLLGFAFSALFIGISTTIKTWELNLAVTNLLNLPLMFASSALLPVKQMPEWLQSTAKVNPITYAVDTIRMLVLNSSSLDYAVLAFNLGVLGAFTLAFLAIGLAISYRALTK